MYYKSDQLRLSQECLDAYPTQFYQEYKHYEFLECAVYLKHPGDPNDITCILGRFKGMNKEVRNGITRVTIYDSISRIPNDFDLLHRMNYSIFLDDRMKYHCHQYPIHPNCSCIHINIYPIYQKQLLLLYFHLLKQKSSLLPECMGVISQYLKPRSLKDYQIIWMNGARHYFG
tara:strand:- start:528 stop:1046 length:519 start_codon:yes stop_codon:yes gene_type:complete